MGTFIGHISPGLAFFSFGLLYSIRYSWMVLNGDREQYRSRTKPARNFLCSLPVEGVMKMFYGLMAVLAEFFFPPGVQKLHFFQPGDPEFHFVNPNEWQHATMYGYFCLSGALDIVSQSCLHQRCPLLEHMSVTAAFFVTTLLLKFHAHGKEAIEVQVHSLLLLTCALTCAIFIVEIWWPNQRKLWFAKAWLVLIQGSWLFHAAFILYRPSTGHKWDSGSPVDLMFLTTFYCWHLALNAGLMGALFWATSLAYRRWGIHSNTGYRLAGKDAELEKLTGEADEGF
ncbi:transmembrane epididymal protein 1A-like [Bombina bombina]|uniref:transmembrane epididymal protein 1A-like n=1 Tax=Bombina bombina TaxID=8345 RepID=UPI00235A960C|nr:transmembrane epididymal protein 1A-like [Bombina bombina]